MHKMLQYRSLRLFGSAIAALVGYGIWGYFVNGGYGHDIALRAGSIQGLYAFLVTLSTAALLEVIFLATRRARHQLFVSFLTINGVAILMSWSLHTASGTPNIFWTMVPGVAIGAFYSANYLLLLRRLGGLTAKSFTNLYECQGHMQPNLYSSLQKKG